MHSNKDLDLTDLNWFNWSFLNVGVVTGIYFAIGTSSGTFILRHIGNIDLK